MDEESIWYWVEAPDRTWKDYGHEELREALAGREVKPNWRARRHDRRRWTTVQRILNLDEAPEGPQDSSRNIKSPPHARRQHVQNKVEVRCLACASELRFQKPERTALIRCPRCLAKYRVRVSGGDGSILLVFPISLPPSLAGMCDGSLFPDDTSSALRCLGLEPNAVSSEIRKAYCDLIKKYHPDRLAGLAEELQLVAERKTKELNAAYAILKASM